MKTNSPTLVRGLERRHIELLALGGTIGVGLFMGSASTLKWTGPSVLLAYALAGMFVFFIMRSMGEMLFLEPTAGSFVMYAHQYIGPLAGYLTAWCYWFFWMTVGISEIVAIGLYAHFWFPALAPWIPGLIGVAIVAAANLTAVRLYGEFEFWFSIIKVSTIVVMILLGLAIIFLGWGNEGHAIGFQNLTAGGHFFAGGWGGFLFALCLVVGAYQGVELVGIAAGEAKNPQVTLRKAISRVMWRVLIFYIGAIFIIIAIYPYNQIGTEGSPFVLIFQKVGIAAAAGIINFVILTAALSGCNSAMYSCGRMFYTLSHNHQLPAFFAKLSPKGIPANAIKFSVLCLLAGSSFNYILPNPEKVFVYIYSASVMPAMAPWFVVLISQFRFRKAHQAEMATHPFKSLFFPYANYATLIFLAAVLIGMAFNHDTRVSLLVGVGFLAIITLVYFFTKSRAKQI